MLAISISIGIMAILLLLVVGVLTTRRDVESRRNWQAQQAREQREQAEIKTRMAQIIAYR